MVGCVACICCGNLEQGFVGATIRALLFRISLLYAINSCLPASFMLYFDCITLIKRNETNTVSCNHTVLSVIYVIIIIGLQSHHV